MKHGIILVFGALSTLITAGCSHSEPPPTSAAAASTTPAATPEMEAKKQTDVENQAQISIADEIKKACNISDPDAYFAFDSAKVTEQGDRVLKQLADCFTTGPMKGKIMRLVGHCDPRGSEDYNMVLGQHRADNVKQFLTTKGLAADRAQTSSRGKMDATGTDEATWAKDRRVDVLVAT
jgi:peptidoglycan-associated lipoprotein